MNTVGICQIDTDVWLHNTAAERLSVKRWDETDLLHANALVPFKKEARVAVHSALRLEFYLQ